MWRTVLKAGAATALFALIHSALASRQAKEAAARYLGRRNRNGLYRWFYILQSVVTLAALFAYLATLPNRVVYRLRGPVALLAGAAQVMWMLYAVWTAYEVGLTRITGLASLWSWLRGDADVPAEPEAQGPAHEDGAGMRVRGPFRWSRHPLNWVPVQIFWLMPTMTLRRLAFSVVGTVYLVLGSVHEETRLRAAYGADYEAYRRSGVPFYIPWPDIPAR